MTGFALRTGLVFDWNGAAHRIERIQPNGDVLLEKLIDGALTIAAKATLLDDYAKNRISTRADADKPTLTPALFSRPMADLSEDARREVARRRHYIDSVASQGRPLFTKPYLAPVLRSAAEAIGDASPPSIATFWRWWARFQLNKDTRALIPRHDRKGPSAPRQPSAVMRLLAEAMEEAYRVSPSSPGTAVHVALERRIAGENQKLLPHEQLQVPSVRTVQRLLRDASRYELTALKEGKAAADREFRSVQRSTVTSDILERVEVDHTPLDLFLVDDHTMLPVGRPTLTVIIDHFSRMLLGYYLSYGSPSTAAVMAALRHAILPKTPVEILIPGLKVENAWPCYGRPRVMVLDNGLEFHSVDLESVALDLGIVLQFCPKREPRFKGVVERYLKTVNYSFAHQLPGTSFAKLHLRGDYDPVKHALMTIGEFRHLFEKWLLDIYAQTPHRGIRCTPWAKWHEGASRCVQELPADLRGFQRRIGLVEERTVQAYGIDVNNIRYNGPAVARIVNGYGAGTPVRVVVDPEDVGEIQVWGPDDEEPAPVPAKSFDFYNGLTLFQSTLIHSKVKEDGLSTHDAEALRRAKHQISEAVVQLLGSRKQRDRRRSAAMRGISSARPADAPSASGPTMTTRAERQHPARLAAVQPQAVPVPIESFQMKRKRTDPE